MSNKLRHFILTHVEIYFKYNKSRDELHIPGIEKDKNSL